MKVAGVAAAGFFAALCCLNAVAEQNTAKAPSALSVQARLDFTINIGKFIFLKVGSSGSGSISTVSFLLTPALPPGAQPLQSGNGQPAIWNGALPTFAIAASGNVLPVEVRSNGGTVSLRASVVAPMTNGTSAIPLNQITISSSDSTLPAPAIPSSGTGSAVTVSPTGFGNLVTARTASWTFNYSPTVLPAAGSYSGQVIFTATAL